MENPFHIFPSIGYKNSEFQLRAADGDIDVEVYFNDELIHQLHIEKNVVLSLISLNKAGEYLAKCTLDGVDYKQKIEVKDAIRFGTSEFKAAFVFDEIDFSFIVMKDRLLLYDEKNDKLLTENRISPTDIRQLDSDNFLFIKTYGAGHFKYNNYYIYNIKTFNIIHELLNYKELQLLVENNILWVHSAGSGDSGIRCFEILNSNGNHFVEKIRYNGIISYQQSEEAHRLLIVQPLSVYVVHTKKMTSIKYDKTDNTVIDTYGNYYELSDSDLKCYNYSSESSTSIKIDEPLCLTGQNYVHVGKKFQNQHIPLSERADVIQSIQNILASPYTNTIIPYNGPELSQMNYFHQIFSIKDTIIIEKIFELQKLIGYNEIITNGLRVVKPNIIADKRYSVGIGEMIAQTGSTQTKIVHNHNGLVIKNELSTIIYFGNQRNDLGKIEKVDILYFDEQLYFLAEIEKNIFSLYSYASLTIPIFSKVSVLNKLYIQNHRTIWYQDTASEKNNYQTQIKGYNLEKSIFVDVQSYDANIRYLAASQYVFNKEYILGENKILINPQSGICKNAVLGNLVSISKEMDKIITLVGQEFNYLKFDFTSKRYNSTEIKLGKYHIKESYLSPNGKTLLIKNASNEYQWYDIEKGTITNFNSGTFIAFTKDSEAIVEEDRTRRVKIIDPKTFEEITQPNYHYYKFLSPDGSLYVDLAKMTRYIHIIDKVILSNEEVEELKIKLGELFPLLPTEKVEKNKAELYQRYKDYFEEINLSDSSAITFHKIVLRQEYIHIGNKTSELKVEVIFPLDLQYYNYGSFSHDNNFFGYVGKPTFKGYINIMKINVDKANGRLSIIESIESRKPSNAAWVCSFSKKGLFATYDSKPSTYLIEVKQLFDQIDEINKKPIFERQIFIDSHIKEIRNRSFLCFSPSGNFIALSDQGYDPISMGGSGHIKSNAVYLINSDTHQEIVSFIEHGDEIKFDQTKKVNFVAFSEDERKLMSLSNDGVVIVRDVNLQENLDINFTTQVLP
jgi:WD40 repeat protein